MKVQYKDVEEKKTFKPFEFTVTVESEEEARLWWHVFNTANLAEIILKNSNLLFPEKEYLKNTLRGFTSTKNYSNDILYFIDSRVNLYED